MIAAIHQACGKPAFHFTERPVAGYPLNLDTVRLLDGSRPVAGTAMKCGSCSGTIWNTGPDQVRLEP